MSRYTDYEGYWLFGFLVPLPARLEINLLAEEAAISTPLGVATQRARKLFDEQLRKGGFTREQVQWARLSIGQDTEQIRVLVSHRPVMGWQLHILVEICADTGKVFRVGASGGVAVHDPGWEMQSG